MNDCFESILAGLRQTRQAIRDAEQARLEQEAKWREQELRRIEEQQRLAEQARKLEQLRQWASEWNESVRLCAFLDEFEKHASKLGCDLSEASGTGRWIAWARAYSRRLDPMNRTTMDESEAGTVVISPI